MQILKIKTQTITFHQDTVYDCSQYAPVAAIVFINQGKVNALIDNNISIPPGEFYQYPIVANTADQTQYRITFPVDSPAGSNSVTVQTTHYIS